MANGGVAVDGRPKKSYPTYWHYVTYSNQRAAVLPLLIRMLLNLKL
jgi:hypothetical protein